MDCIGRKVGKAVFGLPSFCYSMMHLVDRQCATWQRDGPRRYQWAHRDRSRQQYYNCRSPRHGHGGTSITTCNSHEKEHVYSIFHVIHVDQGSWQVWSKQRQGYPRQTKTEEPDVTVPFANLFYASFESISCSNFSHSYASTDRQSCYIQHSLYLFCFSALWPSRYSCFDLIVCVKIQETYMHIGSCNSIYTDMNWYIILSSK